MIKHSIKKVINNFGYEIIKNDSSISTELLNNYSYPEALYFRSKNFAFYCDIDICMNLLQFSFSPSGWHPFVAFLKKNNISILEEYFEKYSPRSLEELFFEGNTINKYPQIIDDRYLQIAPRNYVMPWFYKKQSPNERKLGLHIGPPQIDERDLALYKNKKEYYTKNKINIHGRHLKDIYESIRINGYNPVNDIKGYFLRDGDKFRFLVLEGEHRAAALSILGYKKVRVTFSQNIPRVIDYKDINYFSQVVRNEICHDTAKLIFKRYFTQDGKEKAQNIGISSKYL